jgi:UDP-N-acetylmuramoyl-tripeptide--D-alanyl-D-alanine ligase
VVRDVVEAIARYGRRAREKFHGQVVGITGSAGKTTTKEFVAAAVSPLGRVLKSEGNRNTEYTSPLVWSELDSDTKVVVVEMAMRGFGQIAHLASVAQPTVRVVTNIGYAHLQQVRSREGIANAKGELLTQPPPEAYVVLWAECDFLRTLKGFAATRSHKTVTFGFTDRADCRVTRYEPLSWTSARVEGSCNGWPWEAELPAIGRHVALDAAAAVLVASLIGVQPQTAADQLAGVQLPPMRMEVREFRGATVLLDTYNASPPSMISAIETLSEMPVTGRRLALLGEMRELGDYTEQAHRNVGHAVRESEIDEVLLVGEAMRFAAQEIGEHRAKMAGNSDDVRQFVERITPGDVLIVKGSRALELEKILELGT